MRAQGMGGAFTAVADDATASWWNPAGLASGAYLNLIFEYGEAGDAPGSDNVPHRGIALAFPALGLSYYRMTVSEIAPSGSTGGQDAVRQEEGTIAVRSVEVSQFGATIGQSLGNHLVLASTLKLNRAAGESEGDLDVGAMAIFGMLRAGVTVRNARETTFGTGDEAFTLQRQVRAGVAVSSASSTAFGGATIAVDADLQPVMTAFGDERRIAAGAELWTKGRRLGARGGFSRSTLGDSRNAASGGVSVAIRQGIYADAQLTGGSDQVRKGWALALRVTF